MKKIILSCLAIALLGAATALLEVGCKNFVADNLNTKQMSNLRKISGDVRLGGGWIEITPQPPLEVREKIQFVGLKLENVKGITGDNNQKILLKDGSQLSVDVEIVDEKGNITVLYPNGKAEFVEFGKRTKNRENPEEALFSEDEIFTKVRIRCDKPIAVKEIVWIDFAF